MAIEVSIESLNAGERFHAIECMTYNPSSNSLGKDPLTLLLELEQLAADHGYNDIHQFISDYLE